ncbi:LmbU family transcriptional regulator [Streptomyces tauricus]|uniref:LmbU family transcriptional regulator n=1 Tax=Streptomyces tauricus TaxID=68274 RepID=UPI0022441AF2|nr:LmbU family transcriptional regulator [Streptomyces tauricus]MCW8096323.1 LmbU family transcriptional regulator [Streptomyces tauricus]
MGDLPARAQKGELSNLNFAQREAVRRATVDTSTFVTRKGLLLPKQISFDKWVGVGSYLSNIFSSSAWCLGDWLVYGEATFNGRYHDAIKLTSLDYQTLRNHAWVARRFHMSRRRDTLSFTHHAEVAALAEPEQDFWLRKAEEYAWSAKRLRREVKASLRERASDLDEEPGKGRTVEEPGTRQPVGETAAAVPETDDTVLLRVSVSADCLESCHAAASRLGLKVETWASQILLVAAAQTSDAQVQQDGLLDRGPAQDRPQRDAAGPDTEGDDPAQQRQRDGIVRSRGRTEHGPSRRGVRQVH